MMLHTHALIGAGVAKHVKTPVVGVVAVTISHLVMDITPHVEWSTFGSTMIHWVTFLDVGLLIVITAFSPILAKRSVTYSLTAVIGSIFYDLLYPVVYINPSLREIYQSFNQYLHFLVINTLQFTLAEKLFFQLLFTILAIVLIVWPRQLESNT
jgi:hypothetical protein